MRIGIDVDGVIADNHTAWLDRYNAKYVKHGAGFDPTCLTQWEVWKDLGCTKDEIMSLYTPDMYNEILPYPDALVALQQIAELGHEIVYITTCYGLAEWDAKCEWLRRHGFADVSLSTFGVGEWATYKTKADVARCEEVQWLVDDHVPNAESWPGYALLLTRPHNKNLPCRCKRVRTLDDVVTLLSFTRPGDTKPNAVIEESVNPTYPPLALAPTPEKLKQWNTWHGGTGSPLPTDKQARKHTPITSGALDYFPAALAEVARVSWAATQQHHPGQPMHWERGKSSDHADCISRHLIERGTIDDDGQRHSAKVAWRALALLQEELEAAGAPMSRASKVSDGA